MDLKTLETSIAKLEELMTKTPNWLQLKLDDETKTWMSETYALLKTSGEVDEAKSLKEATGTLSTLVMLAGARSHYKQASEIYSIKIDAMLNRALASMKAQALAMQNVDTPVMGSVG